MKNFTFFIKHIVGNANEVVDALSKRCLVNVVILGEDLGVRTP
jgi:hypothetical protein